MLFCPSYHFARAFPLLLDVEYLFLVGTNVLLSTDVQKQAVILEFSEEKMSACPSTLPYCMLSKVQCCKEQYCIGTWNVRSMNQGKLEVVKQEMARVNINILGISELKWTWVGECNSDDHYIYYRGQESPRRNGVALIINKRVWNAVLGFNLKNNKIISVHFQAKTIQYHSNTSPCPSSECWRTWMIL